MPRKITVKHAYIPLSYANNSGEYLESLRQLINSNILKDIKFLELNNKTYEIVLEALLNNNQELELEFLRLEVDVNTSLKSEQIILKLVERKMLPNLAKFILARNFSQENKVKFLESLRNNYPDDFREIKIISYDDNESFDLIKEVAKYKHDYDFYSMKSWQMMSVLKDTLQIKDFVKKTEYTDIALINFARLQNYTMLRMILDNPEYFPITLNFTLPNFNRERDSDNIMRFYDNNLEMQEYLFSKGFAPMKVDTLNDFNNLADDSQNTHTKVINKKVGWVLNRINTIVNDDNEINTKLVDRLANQITNILLSENAILNTSLFNTRPSSMKDVLKEGILNNNAEVLELIAESENNQNENNALITSELSSEEKYIKFIVKTASNTLAKVFLTKDEKGEYTCHAAASYKYYSNPSNQNETDSITIPKTLAVIKEKFVDVNPSLVHKQEIFVTLCNKNPSLVQEHIEQVKQLLNINDTQQLSDRAECFRLLTNINEGQLDDLFYAVSGQDLTQCFQTVQLFKLATAIASAGITYGVGGPSCIGGFFGRVSMCVADELDSSLGDEYHSVLTQERQFTAELTITESNVGDVVNNFIDEIIERIREDNNLYTHLLDFITNTSGKVDLTAILVEDNIIYAAINNAILNSMYRLPTLQEYELILDNVAANYKLTEIGTYNIMQQQGLATALLATAEFDSLKALDIELVNPEGEKINLDYPIVGANSVSDSTLL